MKLAMIMMPSWDITEPPIATAYLSYYLRTKRYDVDVFDFNIELYHSVAKEKQYLFEGNHFEQWLPKTFDDIVCKELNLDKYISVWCDKVISSGVNVVGFSIYYSNYLSSIKLAEAIKKKAPNIFIIFGGPQSSRHEQGYSLIKSFCVDMVVIGEGELILEKILKALKEKTSLTQIESTLYMENNYLYDNKESLIFDDINQIPFPTFEDFNIKAYTEKMLPILSSRGCINYCKFCGARPFWAGYRCRSAESIVKEMVYLNDRYAINVFDIVDALMNGNIDELDRLCDLLIAHTGEKIYWGGKAIIRKELDKLFLKKMYAAGCRWLSYGIESGSQKIVNLMGKNFDLKLARKVLKNSKKAKITVSTFFIIGFPGETFFDFLKTLSFIVWNRRYIGSISSGQKCGLPEDSILFCNFKKYGISFQEDGWYHKTSTPKIRNQRHKCFKILTAILRLRVVHG